MRHKHVCIELNIYYQINHQIMAHNSTKHVAVLAFPFATHAHLLFKLVNEVSKASPHATFSFFSTAQSNSAIFKDSQASDSIKPCNIEDGISKDFVFSGSPIEAVERFLQKTPQNFESSMEKAVKESGKAFSCLITDAFLWFGADMARDLQIPWVAVWTSGPRSVFIHLQTELIREKLGIHGNFQLDKKLDFLPGFESLPATHIPEDVIAKDLTTPFASMLHKMGLNLPKATAVCINSFEEIDSIPINQLKSTLQDLLTIGLPLLTLPPKKHCDPQGCLEWLDKQKQDSVVYISFGSMIMPPPHELTALAEALEYGGFHFIWSFKGNPSEKLPKEFLDRTKEKGIVVSWAPQLQVLQHHSISAFISHGGWNSVVESIIGSVPLICRPFFGDHHLNSWTVEAVWGIGLEIEGGKITKDGTMKALQVVQGSEKGQKMKHKVVHLNKLVVDAVSSQGSSTLNFEKLIKIVT
ncbi:flavonoid 3-O-glucosyltransferase-like [Mercurialis annua]|uniref:flavonoid 3-O-glucosyltransferase-like n=1 Tax=Mercurialis annua TaxID=3986 RepID=UPI0024AE2E75|nr:flavonoid 3-O-glucosyltransferase-like [Mercurialis annua]